MTAEPEVFGELPGAVGAGVINDPARRTRIEVDVVVMAPTGAGERRRILALGEAKWGKQMGLRHVERLARARDLLAARDFDTQETVLACYGGAGFDDDLRGAAANGQVLLIDLPRLYEP